jgi:hypothetical protein
MTTLFHASILSRLACGISSLNGLYNRLHASMLLGSCAMLLRILNLHKTTKIRCRVRLFAPHCETCLRRDTVVRSTLCSAEMRPLPKSANQPSCWPQLALLAPGWLGYLSTRQPQTDQPRGGGCRRTRPNLLLLAEFGSSAGCRECSHPEENNHQQRNVDPSFKQVADGGHMHAY